MFNNYTFKECRELRTYSCEDCMFHRKIESSNYDRGCFSPKGEPFESCKTRHIIFVPLDYVEKRVKKEENHVNVASVRASENKKQTKIAEGSLW